MVTGVGPEHAGGGRTPGITCKRIADRLPVVVVSDADEVSRLRPQAGRGGTTSEIATGGLQGSTGSTRTEDSLSGSGRRQTVLASRSPPQSVGPTSKLGDVTQAIKFDNQELEKYMHEQQGAPDGGGFRFANENQPYIEQESRLNRLAAYQDSFPLTSKPRVFGWNAGERSLDELSQAESHSLSTTPLAEDTSEGSSVTNSFGAARGTQVRKVLQPKECQVPQTSLGAGAFRGAAGRSGKARAKQRSSKSPGSLVRGLTESRKQLVESPRPLSVRGLGDKRTGPVVADHKLGEDALRRSQSLGEDALRRSQSQESRREVLEQKISSLSNTSLKERAEALTTMTETERVYSTMRVKRAEQINSNKLKAADTSREPVPQVSEDILFEVGRIESTSQATARLLTRGGPATSEMESARSKGNEPEREPAGDCVHENVNLLTESTVTTVPVRGFIGDDDDDTMHSATPRRVGPGREPLGEILRSSTDTFQQMNAEMLKSSIDSLTQQMKGIFEVFAANDGPKTKIAASADSNPVPRSVSPPPLTASIAQAVHTELERLVIGQPCDSSEDTVNRSIDGPVTLNTTSTELSSSTREAVERLSSNTVEATPHVAAQVDRLARGPAAAAKRVARQPLLRSPHAEPAMPMRSPARLQRAPRDNSDDRRKRLGTTGILRPEGKTSQMMNMSTIGAFSQGLGSDMVDGALPFESVDADEALRDTLPSSEVAANLYNAEEPKKRRGWYNPERAREMINEKEREAAERRKFEEEREKRRQEQLRRLESAYKAKKGSATGGSKAGPPKPSSAVSNVATQPGLPEHRIKQQPPASAAGASAAGGSKPQSRGTSVSSFQPPPRKVKGVGAPASSKKRPKSAGATSRRRWNEAFEDLTTRRENANPRAAPHAGHQARRNQNLLEEIGSAAPLASLSDGGESSEGSRRFQEPRLATKFRKATIRRARDLLRGTQSQIPTPMTGEAWADSYEPSSESHTVSLQGDRREMSTDIGFQFMWPNEPSRQRGDRTVDDLGWTAVDPVLDPTQWPPTRHAALGLADPANRDPSSDGSNPSSPGFVDFPVDARSQPRPSSYLTADHRRIVDEVVAEQRWWRSRSSSFSHPEVQGMRPPSRGGESCQPLGPTSPPSYENDLPETYSQYQPLIRSLERPASPYADITDDDDESVTQSFVENQDVASSHSHVEAAVNQFGGFHHSPAPPVASSVGHGYSQGYSRPDGVVGGTAVADTIYIEDTAQLDDSGSYSDERRSLEERQYLGLDWTSPHRSSPLSTHQHDASPCGASNKSSSVDDLAVASLSYEIEEAEVAEGELVFPVDVWLLAEGQDAVEVTAESPRRDSARSYEFRREEGAVQDEIAATVNIISDAIEDLDEERNDALFECLIDEAINDGLSKKAKPAASSGVNCSIDEAFESAPSADSLREVATDRDSSPMAKTVTKPPAETLTDVAKADPSAAVEGVAKALEGTSLAQVTGDAEADRCVCGSIFHQESIYCMRCGTKRPKANESPEVTDTAKAPEPPESSAQGHRIPETETATSERTISIAKVSENAKVKAAEEIVSVVMDELLEDSLQVAQSARSEPALRHPTPNAAFHVSAITEMYTEDSKSESDSAESERKTPPGSRRTDIYTEDPEAVAKAAARKAQDEMVKAIDLATAAVTPEQAEAASEAARNASQFAKQAEAAAAKAHALVEAARSRVLQQPSKAPAAMALTPPKAPVATTLPVTTTPPKPTLAGEESPSDAKSVSSTSSSSDSSLRPELHPMAINAKKKEKKEARTPFGMSSGDMNASEKKASSPKEPPRPPSPPPDMRSTAAAGSGDAGNEYRGFRSRDEVADLVTDDMMQMLLTEVWNSEDLFGPSGDTSSPRRSRRGHSEEIRGSKAVAVGDRSPPKRQSLSAKAKLQADCQKAEEARLQDSEDKPNKHGYQGIDTSESFVAPFFASVMKALGVTDEDCPVQVPVASSTSWLPSVLEVMRIREGGTKPVETAEVGEGVPRAAEASLAEDNPISPSSGSRHQPSREHDMESWTRLLADALVEIAGEEVKAEPRALGWRRPGYGEPPLSRFRAQQVAEGKAARPQQTWKNVKTKLEEATRFACRSDAVDDSASGKPVAGGHDDPQNLGPIGNIDEKIEQLIEDGIAADEASWLDIGNDVLQVKNQVVQMIFSDLVEETAAEIQKLWPIDPGQLCSPG